MTDNITDSIKQYSDRLFSFVHRIIRDREESLDLLQEIYIKVLDRFENIKDKNKLKAYLFRTAYNLSLNFKRDDTRRVNILDSHLDNLIPKATDQPDTIFESIQQKEDIENALENLSEKQKEAVIHRFYGELKISEISKIMKISEGTVKVHLSRGLHNLKNSLYNTIGKERL